MKGIVTMSAQEVGRIDIFERLMRKEIKQKHAARFLDISTRQIRTLLKRYKREGAAGIVHKLRGIPGNRKISEVIIKEATDKVRSLYPDFSPTLDGDSWNHFLPGNTKAGHDYRRSLAAKEKEETDSPPAP